MTVAALALEPGSIFGVKCIFLPQVVFVAWLVATAWFLVTYHSPCQPLPSKEQLSYYESSGEDQDIYAGVSGFDSRGLKFFPQLW